MDSEIITVDQDQVEILEPVELMPAQRPASSLVAMQDFNPDDLLGRFIAFIDRKPTTTKSYITCLRQFFEWMQANGITNPTRQDILAYRDYLDGSTFGRTGTEELRAGTRTQYIRALKQFFSWLAAEHLYENVAVNIHGPKVRQGAGHKKDNFQMSEVMTILDNIDRSTEDGKRLYAMILLMARRGLRTVEISRANVKDLHKRNGHTYLAIYGKGHDEADTARALDPDTVEAIEDYLQSRQDKPTAGSPLFVSTSNRSKGKRIAPTTISTMVKEAIVNAGFVSDRLTPHSLRHTAGTMAAEEGDLFAAQIFLRHEDPRTTEIYTHVNDLEIDRQLALKIYNRYHDDEDEATQRQALAALVETISKDKLQEALEYLQSLAKAV